MRSGVQQTYIITKVSSSERVGFLFECSDEKKTTTFVTGIIPDTAAERSGILVGDAMVKINGVNVTSAEHCALLISNATSYLKVIVSRGDSRRPMTPRGLRSPRRNPADVEELVQLRLTPRDASTPSPDNVSFEEVATTIYSAVTDASKCEKLIKNLRVSSVDAESVNMFRVGDVVVGIDGRPIHDVAQMHTLLAEGKEDATISVWRKQQSAGVPAFPPCRCRQIL